MRIFIAAAEPSADLHGAALIRAVRSACPEARFIGLAGPRMQAEGCEPLDDLTSHAAMLAGTLGILGRAYRILRRVREYIRSHALDAVVPIDSPLLNLRIARYARQVNVPVLYYIAPQAWAWGWGRIRRIRRRVNRIAAILPFEEAYFRRFGIDATFVGHPLIERLAEERPDSALVEELRSRGRPVIACLPGSRRHVVDEVLPAQIEIAHAIRQRHPDARFLFVAASDPIAAKIAEAGQLSGVSHQITTGRNAEIIRAADLVLVASGTATLEVAYHRRPMVVMYNASKWGYRLIGRWIIRTPHLSLVNILAARALVPEFMPYFTSADPIVRAALRLLEDQGERDRIVAGLDGVIKSLGNSGASARTAALLLDLVGCKSPAD